MKQKGLASTYIVWQMKQLKSADIMEATEERGPNKSVLHWKELKPGVAIDQPNGKTVAGWVREMPHSLLEPLDAYSSF